MSVDEQKELALKQSFKAKKLYYSLNILIKQDIVIDFLIHDFLFYEITNYELYCQQVKSEPLKNFFFDSDFKDIEILRSYFNFVVNNNTKIGEIVFLLENISDAQLKEILPLLSRKTLSRTIKAIGDTFVHKHK